MRKARSTRIKVFSLMSSLILLPVQASAEAFLDFYGGVATTESNGVTVTTNTFCGTVIFFPLVSACSKIQSGREVSFDDSATVGGRIGYWGESYSWLGGALDVSHFNADGVDLEISAVPISLLLMLRVPLIKSEEFPTGRLQPYAAVGPTLAVVDYEVDFRPSIPLKVDETALGGGADLRAGMAWQLNPHVALFGEFRYTTIFVDDDPGNKEGKSGLETTLRTTHFVGGISFRF